jgi:hypothetical protein
MVTLMLSKLHLESSEDNAHLAACRDPVMAERGAAMAAVDLLPHGPYE